MPVFDIIQLGLLHGSYLSLALGALIFGSLFYDPESWLGDYPPDIRSAFGSMSPRARRHQRITGALFAVVLVGGSTAGVRAFLAATEAVGDAPPGYGAIFLYVLVVLTTFNVVDLVAIDGLLIWLQPRRLVLPGTEGMAGYRDVAFHVRGFFIGLFGSIVAAGVVAGAGALWM